MKNMIHFSEPKVLLKGMGREEMEKRKRKIVFAYQTKTAF